MHIANPKLSSAFTFRGDLSRLSVGDGISSKKARMARPFARDDAGSCRGSSSGGAGPRRDARWVSRSEAGERPGRFLGVLVARGEGSHQAPGLGAGATRLFLGAECL